MTQEYVATYLGIHKLTWRNYEIGKRMIPADVLAAFSKLVNEPVEWLLFGRLPKTRSLDWPEIGPARPTTEEAGALIRIIGRTLEKKPSRGRHVFAEVAELVLRDSHWIIDDEDAADLVKQLQDAIRRCTSTEYYVQDAGTVQYTRVAEQDAKYKSAPKKPMPPDEDSDT